VVQVSKVSKTKIQPHEAWGAKIIDCLKKGQRGQYRALGVQHEKLMRVQGNRAECAGITDSII